MAEKRGPKLQSATREEFARIMEISPTAVTHLVTRGVLTRGAPVGRWIVEYGKHMAKVAAGWQSGGADRILEAALLDRSKREEIEIRIAKQRRRADPR